MKLHDYQIGHYGYGYRALDPLRIFGDLMLTQPRSPFQFLYKELHPPPPPIYIDDLSGGHSGEIGHQDFGLFRPLVMPLCAQDHGDISDMAQARPFGVGPRGPTPARFIQGHPATALGLFRHMRDEIFQGLPVCKTPGPRQGHHQEVSRRWISWRLALEAKAASAITTTISAHAGRRKRTNIQRTSRFSD